jgi:hypothetical protein
MDVLTKKKEPEKSPVLNASPTAARGTSFHFIDNRPQSIAQRKLQQSALDPTEQITADNASLQLMQTENTPLFNPTDHEVGPEPGYFTRWYAKDREGNLTPRTIGISFGWVKVGVNHKLDVYQSPQDKILNEVHDVSDRLESGLAEAREEARDRIGKLLIIEERLNQFVDAWVKKNLSIKRLLIGLGISGAIGVAAIYGLSLVHLSKWVYLGITGVSELIALYYAVKWIRNDLLPGMAKILLVGLNSVSMLAAIFKISYDLFNSMPLNNFVWGALPCGLLLGELIVHLATLKNAKKEALKQELGLVD